jgi:ketosteroid isomerase-like protein
MPTRRSNMHTNRQEQRIVSKLPIVTSVCLLAGIASPQCAAESTAGTLKRATQALVDAVAPGERAVWEHYSDPAFTYVTEDNEVKTRAQLLEDLKPLPPGSTGWILVEEFRCTDFGAFAVTTYVMNEHETVDGQELRARYRGSDTWRHTAGGWRLVAAQVYAIPRDPPRADVPAARLADYEGLYSLSPATRQTIRREGDHLVVERAGRETQPLLPESGDVFFSPGRPRTRRIFMRAPDGRVSGFADRREGTDLVWTRLASEAAAR